MGSMSKKTCNNFVACTPFDTTVIKTEVRHHVTLVVNKVDLYQLQVKYICTELNLSPGDTVWVGGEWSTHQTGKKVYDVGDGAFILLPQNAVVLKKTEPPKNDSQTVSADHLATIEKY